MSKKKKALNDINSSANEPPLKKRKIDTNVTDIKSSCFMHPNDHLQFQQLFTNIDNSELSQLLKIPHFINKEIAEFGTGQFIECNNSKCNNQIPILYKNEEIYNNNHENANKLGYKWCKQYDQHYCNQCMDLAKSCDCECCQKLYFLPDADKCNECDKYLCNCECGCTSCYKWECFNCNIKSCDDCMLTWQCGGCAEEFCLDCSAIPNGWDDQCICNNCSNNTLIECNTCNHKSRLIYESNECLVNRNGDIEMRKCDCQLNKSYAAKYLCDLHFKSEKLCC